MEKQLTFLSAAKASPKKTIRKVKHSVSVKSSLAPWEIFVDGASRNNPGPSGAGIYIKTKDEVICKTGYYLGKKTNNQAEYLALLIALLVLSIISTFFFLFIAMNLFGQTKNGFRRTSPRLVLKRS